MVYPRARDFWRLMMSKYANHWSLLLVDCKAWLNYLGLAQLGLIYLFVLMLYVPVKNMTLPKVLGNIDFGAEPTGVSVTLSCVREIS